MTPVHLSLRGCWGRSYILLALLIGLCAMHAHAGTYYVATNGNNNNPGTQASPWRTITFSATRAVAGDHIYIKGGNYGNEHVVVKNSGSAGSPIIFEGYDGWPVLGTLPSPRTNPADTEIGFRIWGPDYITVKNLKFTWYYECFRVDESDYVICDNLWCDTSGGTGAKGSAIVYKYSNYGQILNCTVEDCGGNNVFLSRANYMLIDNLTSLGTLQDETGWATDYYCVLRCCHDCTIQNSYAEDTLKIDQGNHGFIIKDAGYTPYSYNNVIQDCEAIGFGECFCVAHYAYNNTFQRCHGDTQGKDNGISYIINCRNGAHDNTFREITGISRHILIGLSEEEEGSYGAKDDNLFINCVLKGTPAEERSIGVLFRKAPNNTFQNCVLDNVQYLARYITDSGYSNAGNVFKNSILSGMNETYDPDVDATQWYPMGGSLSGSNSTSSQSWTYSDFWDNDFSAFSGTGNISSDPKFADRANADYHLKSTGGRWNGSTWVIDSDHSPCIDAGDPASSYSNEPTPNGGRINIGGYGNTAKASKSETGSLPSNMDNRLKQSTPDTVLNNNSFLDVGYNGTGKYRDITWFDLDPYMDDGAAAITNAKLSMYWYFPPSTTRAADTVVQIMKPESGWDHNYVTWNNKSNGTAWTYAGGDWTDANDSSQGSTAFASVTFPAGTVPTNQYYDWDVTHLVQDIITAGVNPGMFIKASAESTANYIAFYGAAGASNRPKLSITRLAAQTEGSTAYDNRLKQSTPDTVLLTSTFNDVGGLNGSNYRDLIWFDLSPYDDVETITSAKLSLYWYYPNSTRTNNTVVDIYRPAAGWDRNYVTWNTKSSGVSWAHAGGDWYDANGTSQGSTPFASITFSGSQLPTSSYYEFDVTALVNYYRTNGGNAGFFIKARTEGDNYIAFYSLNNASNKPKLEITTTIQQP